jgi:hypothetical protein
MARTPGIISQGKNYSPNLELDNSVKTKSKSKKVQRIPVKRQNFSQKQPNLTNFWCFILTTSLVFSFGGLGFGIALRYAQTGMMVNYLTSDNQPDLVNYNQ